MRSHNRNTKIKIEQNDKNQMKADPHKSNGQIFHHYIIRLLLFWLLPFAKIIIKCATATTTTTTTTLKYRTKVNATHIFVYRNELVK